MAQLAMLRRPKQARKGAWRVGFARHPGAALCDLRESRIRCLRFVWRNGAAEAVEIVDYHRSRGRRMANKGRLPPIHPGEILREEFLAPLGLSSHQLALALRVPATRLNDIVNQKRGITADTALRPVALLRRHFQILDEPPGFLEVGGGRRPAWRSRRARRPAEECGLRSWRSSGPGGLYGFSINIQHL